MYVPKLKPDLHRPSNPGYGKERDLLLLNYMIFSIPISSTDFLTGVYRVFDGYSWSSVYARYLNRLETQYKAFHVHFEPGATKLQVHDQ
jgi:hypothetical protein